MTAVCAPPEGLGHIDKHWFRSPGGRRVKWGWTGRIWLSGKGKTVRTPDGAYHDGYRYLEPVGEPKGGGR